MIISLKDDFSYTPGPRYIRQGQFSGEQFRQNILAPAVRKAIESGSQLVLVLDGTAGIGRSFLEEISGGLIREERIPYSSIEKSMKFVSDEIPEYKSRIEKYLKDAHTKEAI